MSNPEQTTSLTQVESNQNLPVLAGPFSDEVTDLLFDEQKHQLIENLAEKYAKSDLVPKHCKGKPDNCFILIQMACRMKVDPFMMIQQCYIVHGKPGIEAKLAIALCNYRGPFVGPIAYELSGEGMGRECTAVGMLPGGRRCEMTVTMQIAKAEGWINKDGSKWKTIPDLMLQYRSATWLIRTICPEVIMGLHSSDELRDSVIDVHVAPARTTEDAKAFLEGPKEEEPDPSMEPEAIQQRVYESFDQRIDSAIIRSDLGKIYKEMEEGGELSIDQFEELTEKVKRRGAELEG
jgi:hypothetical protein